jgi:hypothetical protein
MDAQSSHDTHRETLKQAYGFAEWPGRDGTPAVGVFLPEHEALEGLTLETRVPLGTRAYVDRLAGPPGNRVALWVHQFETAADAQEGLVDQLQSAMAPGLPRCAERGIEVGDVSFCGLADPVDTILFTRGNVLIRVQSIGDEDVSVTDVAIEVDRQIAVRLRRPLCKTRPGGLTAMRII